MMEDLKQEEEFEDKEFMEACHIHSVFRHDLRKLIKKHDLKLLYHDNYDGSDNYLGELVYYSLQGKALYQETVEEMIKNAIK